MRSDAFTDATYLDDEGANPPRLPRLRVVPLPAAPPWRAPAWQRAAAWEKRCRAAERQLRGAREVLARRELYVSPECPPGNAG